MAGFNIYTGNMLETLAGKLAENLKRAPGNPFETEIVIVQSQGITQWLTIQLSEKLGIWSNFTYYMPNRFNHYLFKKLHPELPDSRYIDIELLRWQFMSLIPASLNRREFREIKNYLAGDTFGHRLFQLSGKIANVFDQYLTFRPEMILEWDQSDAGGWQGELWRMAVSGKNILHPPALREKLAEEMKQPGIAEKYRLPGRITVFGISYLPPFHLDIIRMLSQHIDVNLYIFSPTKEFWSHILPERSIIKSVRRAAEKGIPEDMLHLDSGNSLLSSMGKAGKDFFRIIVDDDNEPEAEYIDPGKGSLLNSIQSDILNLTGDLRSKGKKFKSIADGSVTVNSCHSPARESEVLYNYLLDQFNLDSQLEPRDILIVTPDIDNYAPIIHAVFSKSEKNEMKIPVTINDAVITEGTGAADIFFSILDLEKNRYSAGSILDLLENETVRERFDISSSSMEKIALWVNSCNIRWGLDTEYKTSLGLPPVEENTWLYGIKRLLLGYSMPEGTGVLPGGILPYDGIEGEDARLLGRFNSFLDYIFDIEDILKDAHTLEEWGRHLGLIMDRFLVSSDDNDRPLKSLTRAISTLPLYHEASGFTDKIDIRIISEYLQESLQSDEMPGRYITGNVTLASTLPMRTIPFRVICMIGMNHNVFPRTDHDSPFNLIKKKQRAGDRLLRDEDRFIFLETLLSAREKLYISFTGQNIQDNSEIPPSIAVSELLDYIEDQYPSSKDSIINSIYFKHPLQSFSSRYFTKESPIFSYSRENLLAIKNRNNHPEKGTLTETIPGGFISKPIDTGIDPSEIHINDLIAFFMNPARHLLESVVGIYFRDTDFLPENIEPFEIDGLGRFMIEKGLVEDFIIGKSVHQQLARLIQEGELPHGLPGKVQFRRLLPGITRFSETVKAFMSGEKLDPAEISIDVDGINLRGVLDNLRSDIVLHYRYVESSGKNHIKAWIHHLAANAAALPHIPCTTILLNRNMGWKFNPVATGVEILRELIGLYIKGNREPVPFFPNTSFDFAGRINSGRSDKSAFDAASAKYLIGSFNRSGELDDPYAWKCFRSMEGIDFEEFKDISLKFFVPLLQSAEKI